MGMSDFYGPVDEKRNLATLERAFELGINFLDTADMYGPYTNEKLVGRAISGHRRDDIVSPPSSRSAGRTGASSESVASRTTSRKRATHPCSDSAWIYRPVLSAPCRPRGAHRRHCGCDGELVEVGKVRFIGLSEAAPSTIRRAHSVHPITALQTEYSLWSRDPEAEILATTRELGIGFVAYSPLGRGFLSGRFRSSRTYRRGTGVV